MHIILTETMSFKKQQPYQPDMFKVPQLPARLEKQLYDPLASHNQFYKHVFCKIPEDIFSPLYCAYNGRPNASPRLLFAMCAFKAIPKAKRWLRNNVEAAMFQLIPHTQQHDALQGADEVEDFRNFMLPMGELCPLVTV